MLALLVPAGLLAGFIDSIAGGGGLITLPALTLAVGAGPHAIGTNKIVGATGALVALLVYLRAGHMDWARSLAFALWIGVGSFLGSRTAPLMPLAVFPWLLALTCPLILWIVWRKDIWVSREAAGHPAVAAGMPPFEWPIALAGVGCGFYDGIWGPGGGTFMFLALLFVARLPLLTALAAAKFANTTSALAALGGYAWGGYVHWREGAFTAAGMAVGAFLGARFASRRTSRVIRPVLATVAGLLLLRVIAS
jgi:uncharacterized membrane protein YfcA